MAANKPVKISAEGLLQEVTLGKADVGLNNVDNTADLAKPISTATQAALNLKYDASNPSGFETPTQLNTRDANNRDRANHTGTQVSSTISDFAATVRSTTLTGLNLITNLVISASDTVLSALGKLQVQITDNLAAANAHISNVANPHAVTKAQVGLGNVDNTSDLNKPISTATQAALDLKYNASNPSGFETPTQLNLRDANNRDRANHTGTQVASTISDFAATVRSTTLTGLSLASTAVITAADTVLSAFGKLQAQLSNKVDVGANISLLTNNVGYVDVEGAQDATALALTNTETVQFFYNDALAQITATANPIFGQGFQQFLSTTTFSFTNSTPVDAYSFVTTNKSPGLYRVAMRYLWQPGNTNAFDTFTLRVNGTDLPLDIVEEGNESAAATRNGRTLIGYFTLASIGTLTINLRVAQAGAGTSVIHGVLAEVWRVT